LGNAPIHKKSCGNVQLKIKWEGEKRNMNNYKVDDEEDFWGLGTGQEEDIIEDFDEILWGDW
jgi:hypothetical protein